MLGCQPWFVSLWEGFRGEQQGRIRKNRVRVQFEKQRKGLIWVSCKDNFEKPPNRVRSGQLNGPAVCTIAARNIEPSVASIASSICFLI